LVRAQEITGTQPLGNGQFGFDLRGQTSKDFTIYASPDLTARTNFGSVPNPTGSIQFTDSSATNSQNFYRASQP
jgi:hypothetical protein